MTLFLFILLQGLTNGENCVCFDNLPLDQLLQTQDDEMCTVPCNGNKNSICGGVNSVSIFVASKIYKNKLPNNLINNTG